MAAAAVIAAPVAAGPEAQVAPVVPAEGGAPFEGRRRGRGGPPRPRSPSLEDYQLVERQRSQTPEDEIRVAGAGRVTKYVAYATKLLNELGKTHFTIRATGVAISVAISVCEVLKRRVRGLHQVTSIGWTDIVDEYVPLKEGLPPRTEKRSVPSLTVLLSLDESLVDKSAVGYQAPLDDSLIEERPAPGDFEGVGGRRRMPRRRFREGGAPGAEGGAGEPGVPAGEGGEGAPAGPRRRRGVRTRRPRGPRAAVNPAAAPGEAVAAPQQPQQQIQQPQ